MTGLESTQTRYRNTHREKRLARYAPKNASWFLSLASSSLTSRSSSWHSKPTHAIRPCGILRRRRDAFERGDERRSAVGIDRRVVVAASRRFGFDRGGVQKPTTARAVDAQRIEVEVVCTRGV